MYFMLSDILTAYYKVVVSNLYASKFFLILFIIFLWPIGYLEVSFLFCFYLEIFQEIFLLFISTWISLDTIFCMNYILTNILKSILIVLFKSSIFLLNLVCTFYLLLREALSDTALQPSLTNVSRERFYF